MAGMKRVHDDDESAADFFKRICVKVPDDVAVPTSSTVKDIRDMVFHEDEDDHPPWLEKISFGDLKLIKKSLRKDSYYEDILDHKRIVYTPGKEEEEIQRRLDKDKKLIECKTDAPPCFLDNDTIGRRGNSISLVLGPSGSGKTTFCVNGIINSSPTGKEFRVYMCSDDLGTEDRRQKLRTILKEQIRKALKLSTTGDFRVRLDMTLYAIIDEAGNDDYFANTYNLKQLQAIVAEFASDGQLVLSGTGLDLLTSAIGSRDEGIKKIRMLPWNIEDFVKLAKNDNMVQLVKKHFVYSVMVSNARAASYLFQWLSKTSDWGEPDDNVPHVLRNVAYGYISGNGLRRLNNGSRRKVARAVLKVLEACEYDSPEIPPFESNRNLLSKNELSKAKSLIDVHVEKTGLEIKLHDGHHYAVSVTPAIALVLATLLGSSASLVHRWAGFEAVVALNELFRLVRDDESDEVPNYKIVQLDKPYDARKNSATLDVPVMDPFTVLVNGEKASFADVIAPYRLIQVKHTKASNGMVELKIKEELSKMGLLKDSPFEKKVFAYSLYQIWNTDTESILNLDQKKATDHGGGGEALHGLQDRSLYPASLLTAEEFQKKPVCWTLSWSGQREDPKWSCRDTLKSQWEDNWVDAEKPLTVVFVTNAQRFRIKQEVEKRSVERGEITAQDVRENRVREKLSGWTKSVLDECLIKGVKVDFAFARA